MKTKPYARGRLFLAICTAYLTPLGADAQSSSNSDSPADSGSDDIIVLSPFTVEADDGYMANSSLAGTRLNSQLVDIASPIDVLTAELIEDLAAASIDEIIQYGANSDLDIGVQGSDNGQFEFASDAVYIRGTRASRTRDYYPIEQNLDSYNVERVEENRGPNSILFGIGSAAGIINASTKQARLGNSFRRASAMYTSADGYRGTVDLNVALGDKLALRLNAVHKHLDSDVQYHAYKGINAADLAVTYELAKNWRLRGDVEVFDEKSNIGKNRNFNDQVSRWIDAGQPIFASASGVDLAANGVAVGGGNNYRIVENDASYGTIVNYQGLLESRGNGITVWEENNGYLWDRSINDGGPYQIRNNEGVNYHVAIEGRLAENTYLELGHYHGELDTLNYILGQDTGVRGSASEFLRDGVTPNPAHVYGDGLYIGGQWRSFEKLGKYNSYRATLSHELDLARFGNYRFAALAEYDTESRDDTQYREIWVDANGQPAFNANIANSSANRAFRYKFVQLGDWKNFYVGNPAYVGLIDSVTETGGSGTPRTLSTAWRTQGVNAYDNELKTGLIGVQARYFDNRLVLGAGYRRDEMRKRQYASVDDNNVQYRDELKQLYINYNDFDDYDYSATTKSASVVYHINGNFRLIYNKSNNFGLPHPSRYEYPNHTAGAPTEGAGEDYGIGFRFLDDRISGRVTHFSSNSVGSTTFNTSYTLLYVYEPLLNSLVDGGAITDSEATALRMSGAGDLISQKVEGYEFSVTGNPTRNWSVTAKYSYTDGYQYDSLPDMREWLAGNPSGRLGATTGPAIFEANRDLPYTSGGYSTIGDRLDDLYADVNDVIQYDGIGLPKNRRHKARLISRYKFSEGELKGLFIGGVLNYQGEADLGSYKDVNGDPQWYRAGAYTLVDAFVGYSFKQVLGLDSLKLQLNVSNLFDNDDIIPTSLAGNDPSNYSVRRVYYIPPRSWRLTASFAF